MRQAAYLDGMNAGMPGVYATRWGTKRVGDCPNRHTRNELEWNADSIQRYTKCNMWKYVTVILSNLEFI